MNPDTNRFEKLREQEQRPQNRKERRAAAAVARSELMKEMKQRQDDYFTLLRPDGTPVPEHWSVFQVDEHVVVKNYTFKVAYMNEGTLVLEPVGPVIVGETPESDRKPGWGQE